ncbi:protein-disulfide reductase DsbD domain-containing protein [Hansschlegelia plantiphila]|nr:protein-disulfide reductase DsbD domain-containing protein [Hansschlegelia plantiphila]
MFRPTVAVIAVLAFASGARAEPTSPWIGDLGGRLRLVDAGAGPADGERLAAIAIELQPGWKTYWRQPGATGVPPRFDFSGSDNVASVKLAFPTPERAEDEEGVTNVYHRAVTLPVMVRPRAPDQPVTLRLVADYGVCEKICAPVHAETELTLGAGGGSPGPATDDARASLALAPKAAPLGAKGPLAISSVTRAAGETGAAVDVAVAVPDGAKTPDLFAETGDGEYAPSPKLLHAPKDGEATFRIVFDEPDPPASGLRLTLASGRDAVETVVPLDGMAPTP